MRLGRYELGRLLGQGGQGSVYEATLHGPGGQHRRVALKLVPNGAGLRREARLGGLLRHPHLVDVYEVGEHDGTWFLAMEYCPGGSLAALLPLPPRAVVEVGLAVAAALQYAHTELGLVHLDLKPANLLLDGPVVKVADLGVARVDGMERRARIEGTLGYMAPEQRRGGLVDARTDIYTLGVVLHELATGRHPDGRIGSDTVSVEDLGQTPGPPLDRDDAGWLEPILDRCLAQDPTERFASMAELAAALRSLSATGRSLRELFPRPSGAPTNLDATGPSLIGRSAESAEVLDRLGAPGLVTLKGPPGIGKTALAVEVAARFRATTGGEAWFCDLSGARDRADVLTAVARALDLAVNTGDEAAATTAIGHAIGSRGHAVVVLDNFEQVVDHAGLLARWLALGPTLRFLVTSRVALRIVGEQVVEVGVLDEADAVALIEDRARFRGVEVAGDPWVVELARRLDGVPLALELAAGRLGVLSLAEVVERLSLSLLRSGRADVADRQATLQGALTWSYDLLDGPGRAALTQLSVFRGGFLPEAAEATLDLPDGASAGEVVASLLDNSLLVFRRGRLGMLEGVREFAAAKLVDPARAELRHGRYHARFGRREALDALDRFGGTERRRALLAEASNLEWACRRALARGDFEVALATLEGLWAVVEHRGPLPLGLELAQALADSDAPPPVAGAAAGLVGAALVLSGRAQEARAPLDRALTSAREAGDRRAELVLIGRIGVLDRDQGRMVEAEVHLTAALAMARDLGEPTQEALGLSRLGHLYEQTGRVDLARAHQEASLRLHRALGDRRGEGIVLGNLGLLEAHQDRLAAALGHYEQALAIHVEAGDRRAEGVELGNVGGIHLQLGRLEEAREAFQAAQRVNREAGNRRSEGVVLSNLANLLRKQGAFDEAVACYEQALAVHAEVGNLRSEAIACSGLGDLLLQLGRRLEARALLERALGLHQRVGNRRFEGLVLGYLAPLVAVDDPAGAAGMLDRADHLTAEVGGPGDRVLVGIARVETALVVGDLAAARATCREIGALPEAADHAPELDRLRAQLGEA